MKAEELMIGDWVKVNDIKFPYPIQVDGLEKKGGSYYALFPRWELLVIVDKLEPILLTPEILEKNGFIKQSPDGWEYIHPDNNTFSYISYRILYRTYYDNHLFIKKYKGSNTSATLQISYINFVHQLQQALRLCGIDKTIEL